MYGRLRQTCCAFSFDVAFFGGGGECGPDFASTTYLTARYEGGLLGRSSAQMRACQVCKGGLCHAS